MSWLMEIDTSTSAPGIPGSPGGLSMALPWLSQPLQVSFLDGHCGDTFGALGPLPGGGQLCGHL